MRGDLPCGEPSIDCEVLTGGVKAEVAGEVGDGSGEVIFGCHPVHWGLIVVLGDKTFVLTPGNSAGGDDVGADLGGVGCGEVFGELDESAFGDTVADGIAHSGAVIESEIGANLTVDAAEQDDASAPVGGELGANDLGDFESGSDADIEGFLPDFGGLVFDFFGPSGNAGCTDE